MTSVNLKSFPWTWSRRILLIVLLLAPALGNSYIKRLAIAVMLYGISVLSLNILTGYAGIISMGHASFVGLGAYTAAILSVRLKAPFLVTVPAGGLVGAVFGAVAAVVLLRLRGVYVAVGLWALSEVLGGTALNWYALTGGSNGISKVPIPKPLRTLVPADVTYYAIALLALLLTFLLCRRVADSHYGRAWNALRQDERVAAMMGVNISQYRISAMAISAFFAGVSGALFAHYERFVSPDVFSVTESIKILSMLVIGGYRNLTGSIVGAALLFLLPETLRVLGQYRMVIYGGLLIVGVVMRPAGLIPGRTEILDWWKTLMRRRGVHEGS